MAVAYLAGRRGRTKDRRFGVHGTVARGGEVTEFRDFGTRGSRQWPCECDCAVVSWSAKKIPFQFNPISLFNRGNEQNLSARSQMGGDGDAGRQGRVGLAVQPRTIRPGGEFLSISWKMDNSSICKAH